MKQRSRPQFWPSAAGLTWFEFSVLAALLSVLAGALLAGLLYYREMAEAAVVELTVQNVRSGLRYQIADKLIRGREREMGELLHVNPFTWVVSAPAGYVGSVRHADIASLPKGSWFYDVDREEMGYIPKLDFHLSVASGKPTRLLWRMRALRFGPRGSVQGLDLVPVHPYRWF